MHVGCAWNAKPQVQIAQVQGLVAYSRIHYTHEFKIEGNCIAIVKVQCSQDVAIKMNSSIDSINAPVANLEPLYWALWPRWQPFIVSFHFFLSMAIHSAFDHVLNPISHISLSTVLFHVFLTRSLFPVFPSGAMLVPQAVLTYGLRTLASHLMKSSSGVWLVTMLLPRQSELQ